MPWLIQLEIIRSHAPELKSQSHSLELMPRAQVSFLRPARISAHTIAIGVRESVLPPRPTVSPSFTSLAASSSVTTFSWRLRSRSTSFARRSRYDSPDMPRSGVLVEFGDELVPRGNRLLQIRPEGLELPPVEIRDGYALLLDPRVVAEVEHALALDVG